MYADARGDKVYFQVTYKSGELTCWYSSTDSPDYVNFGTNVTYYDGYAECPEWDKGHPEYTIKINLNEKQYFTDENTAIDHGPHPSSLLLDSMSQDSP